MIITFYYIKTRGLARYQVINLMNIMCWLLTSLITRKISIFAIVRNVCRYLVHCSLNSTETIFLEYCNQTVLTVNTDAKNTLIQTLCRFSFNFGRNSSIQMKIIEIKENIIVCSVNTATCIRKNIGDFHIFTRAQLT